jgi:hypothetical protein
MEKRKLKKLSLKSRELRKVASGEGKVVHGGESHTCFECISNYNCDTNFCTSQTCWGCGNSNPSGCGTCLEVTCGCTTPGFTDCPTDCWTECGQTPWYCG